MQTKLLFFKIGKIPKNFQFCLNKEPRGNTVKRDEQENKHNEFTIITAVTSIKPGESPTTCPSMK